ncbi:MAG: MGDG synthase family glycosyltransferase [Endomicrobiia bacterium]
MEVIKKTPQIWDFIYDNPEVKKATEEIRTLFNIININKLKKILDEFNPKVIVCTHAMPANVIAYWKKRDGVEGKLVCVITDHIGHSYWPHQECDLYLIPNEETKLNFIRNGIPSSKIHITGIPVSSEFSKKIDKHTARKFFGLNLEKFTILIMGGSQGLGPISEILDLFLEKPLPAQYIVITGKNKKLYKKLKKKLKNSPKDNIKIFKFIKNISIAMDASDLLITKPGGLTTSEALTKNLPMILIEPLPGQEQRNAEYLTKHRLAERCEDINKLHEIVKTFLKNPEKIEKYRQRMKNFAKPDASELCAKNIIELC